MKLIQILNEVGQKQEFDTPQKFVCHLNNGKKRTVTAKSRYDAKQSLSPNELIIGANKIEHIGPK